MPYIRIHWVTNRTSQGCDKTVTSFYFSEDRLHHSQIVWYYRPLFQVVFVAIAFVAMTSAKPKPDYYAPLVSAYTSPVVSAYSAPYVYSDVAASVVSQPLVSSYYSSYYPYAYYYRWLTKVTEYIWRICMYLLYLCWINKEIYRDYRNRINLQNLIPAFASSITLTIRFFQLTDVASYYAKSELYRCVYNAIEFWIIETCLLVDRWTYRSTIDFWILTVQKFSLNIVDVSWLTEKFWKSSPLRKLGKCEVEIWKYIISLIDIIIKLYL